MADIILNGTTYNGSPTNTANPQRPDNGGVERTTIKVGKMLTAADGSVTELLRGTKHAWKIKWTHANATTMTALSVIFALTTTFPFTDVNAVAYTVLCVTDDPFIASIFTDKGNNYLYDVELVLREA
jgi:hypothetical protein